MLIWEFLLKFSRRWLMINTALASNGSRNAFSITYVTGLNISVCSGFLKLVPKKIPKYINRGKTLSKKINPKRHLIKICCFLGWRLRTWPGKGERGRVDSNHYQLQLILVKTGRRLKASFKTEFSQHDSRVVILVPICNLFFNRRRKV